MEWNAKAAALPTVRLILGITLMLLGVGTLSCHIEGSPRSLPAVKSTEEWVRTVEGWERPAMWYEAPRYIPRIHPLVVAMEQGLISAMCLIAWQRDESLDR
ncbi:MAG TPA: hypothetical protein VFW73_02670 [Lacipirellulaceae bacterium]|nr:hypothetical protein [Lacipirellulaceae bacterium]